MTWGDIRPHATARCLCHLRKQICITWRHDAPWNGSVPAIPAVVSRRLHWLLWLRRPGRSRTSGVTILKFLNFYAWNTSAWRVTYKYQHVSTNISTYINIINCYYQSLSFIGQLISACWALPRLPALSSSTDCAKSKWPSHSLGAQKKLSHHCRMTVGWSPTGNIWLWVKTLAPGWYLK